MTQTSYILIADESEISRQQMANTLMSAGYSVIQAVDGGSAMKVAREHRISVAIIDHFMAPHGGLEFAKWLRQMGDPTPMILITSSDTSDLLLQVTKHGISGYIKKPVAPERLLQAVKRTLRESASSLLTSQPAPRKEEEPIPLGGINHKQPLTNEDAMTRALGLALHNAETGHGGPFAAVVVSPEGWLLGEGVNGITSRCDPTAHAEVMAIRQATEHLNQPHLEGCTIYCTGEPSAVGHALIESVGISKIYYALSHDDIFQMRQPKAHPVIEKEKLGYAQALEVFGIWQALSHKLSD